MSPAPGSPAARKKRGRGGDGDEKSPGEQRGTSRRSAPGPPDESWIVGQCGEAAFRIFNALSAVETEGRTDFALASDLDLPLAQVRRALYRLEDNGLAKRHAYRSGPFSVPSFYTYHANWPRAPLLAVAEEPEKVAATDVPDCYRWTE